MRNSLVMSQRSNPVGNYNTFGRAGEVEINIADTILDMSKKVHNITEMARQSGNILSGQDEMLRGLDNKINNTDHNLSKVDKSANEIIKKQDRSIWPLYVGLIVQCILLIILVIVVFKLLAIMFDV